MAARKQNIQFIVWAYALFWVMIIIALGIMSVKPELSAIVFPIVQVIGSWTPTIALIVLFKKLYPESTLKTFRKNAFTKRLNHTMLLVVTLAYVLITFCMVGYGAFAQGVSFVSLLNISFTGFIVTLFSGALGEEAGWRWHLQQSVEKKNSVLKSCLIVGIIWAFWHMPTWINYITAGLVYFIPLDILSKLSIAFVIGICYHRCRNLFVPIWIHFVTNILVNWTQAVLIDYFAGYIMLQVFLAIGFIVWHIKKSKQIVAE